MGKLFLQVFFASVQKSARLYGEKRTRTIYAFRSSVQRLKLPGNVAKF
jgi:hypothetical protein